MRIGIDGLLDRFDRSSEDKARILHPKEAHVRKGKGSGLVALIVMAVVMSVALPSVAQQNEEFPGPVGEDPLQGYTRSDGTIVLADEAFCSFVLGSLWEGEALTFRSLIDKSKKQKAAKAAAFDPATDEATLARCADVVAAFRTEAPAEDTVVAWARRSPVVPDAFAGLLPDDLVANPLAVAAPVLDAARTSGFGSLVSAPFEVDGETWLVQVDALGCATWSGSLRDARDAAGIIEVDDNREYLYNVTPGHYYWDVTAPDCDWSVDLVAVEIGPDPDATPIPRVPVPALIGTEWSMVFPQENPEFLTGTQARQALLDAGLTTGECAEQIAEPYKPDRVWSQDPIPGTLVEQGTAVNVLMGIDCDVFVGDRVILE